ncbi:MAG: DUF6314 family protein [Kiloniellales bacterium]|nr:DUF6314 family protein [Kiloniellales bacterium]
MGTEPATDGLYPVADLRAYLTGAWEIRRSLDDRLRGERGSFEGRATFSRGEDGTLAYREEGRLALGGFETLAHQRYHYAFPAFDRAPHRPPQRAEVRFADGRPFHELDLGDGLWTAGHRCGADVYRGRFRAFGPDRWWVRWIVTGPLKDQALESLFTRAS